MTIQEIYQTAVSLAMKADPRGEEGVKKALLRAKKEYEEMPQKKKEDFDLESLKNPYSDSRILFGDSSTNVDCLMAGIDIETGEVVLADRLNQKGEGIDLIISHHPEGESLASLHEVMELQVDLLASYGVPVNVAEHLLSPRISEVKRSISPKNHNEAVDAARVLGIPLMCTHTVADNLVFNYLKKHFENSHCETLGEVLESLLTIPEYMEAKKGKAGPLIFVGSEKSRVGKIAPLEITGGTEAAKELYEKMSIAGIGTVISMHASEDHRKEAEKYNINLVVAGHISSDSIGMNLFLDEIEKKGVRIIPVSGFIRVSRIKKGGKK